MSGRADGGTRLELAAVLLMSVTAVLTAWSAFESSKWTGVMAIAFNEASAARVEHSELTGVAGRQTLVDTIMFDSWVEARNTGNAALADKYYQRFRPRLQVAVDAWLARGDANTDGATPFDLPEYQVPATAEAVANEQRAERRAADARAANQTSDNYSLTTVLFAMVLLFAALSTKIAGRLAQRLLLGLAGVVLVTGAIVVAVLPVEI